MPPDRLLLTRPRYQSERFAALCRARFGSGTEIVVAPVMEIVPRPLPGLERYAGVLLTSENAARVLAAVAPPGLPAFCIGPQTAAAARESGFDARAADGDRCTLAAMVAAQPVRGPLLHAHGAHQAGDLVSELASRGIAAEARTVYDQPAVPLSASARAMLAGAAPVHVPLFSPRSARLLRPALESARAPLRIPALSTAFAETVRGLPQARIAIAARRDAAAMLDLLADFPATMLP